MASSKAIDKLRACTQLSSLLDQSERLILARNDMYTAGLVIDYKASAVFDVINAFEEQYPDSRQAIQDWRKNIACITSQKPIPGYTSLNPQTQRNIKRYEKTIMTRWGILSAVFLPQHYRYPPPLSLNMVKHIAELAEMVHSLEEARSLMEKDIEERTDFGQSTNRTTIWVKDLARILVRLQHKRPPDEMQDSPSKRRRTGRLKFNWTYVVEPVEIDPGDSHLNGVQEKPISNDIGRVGTRKTDAGHRKDTSTGRKRPGIHIVQQNRLASKADREARRTQGDEEHDAESDHQGLARSENERSKKRHGVSRNDQRSAESRRQGTQAHNAQGSIEGPTNQGDISRAQVYQRPMRDPSDADAADILLTLGQLRATLISQSPTLGSQCSSSMQGENHVHVFPDQHARAPRHAAYRPPSRNSSSVDNNTQEKSPRVSQNQPSTGVNGERVFSEELSQSTPLTHVSGYQVSSPSQLMINTTDGAQDESISSVAMPSLSDELHSSQNKVDGCAAAALGLHLHSQPSQLHFDEQRRSQESVTKEPAQKPLPIAEQYGRSTRHSSLGGTTVSDPDLSPSVSRVVTPTNLEHGNAVTLIADETTDITRDSEEVTLIETHSSSALPSSHSEPRHEIHKPPEVEGTPVPASGRKEIDSELDLLNSTVIDDDQAGSENIEMPHNDQLNEASPAQASATGKDDKAAPTLESQNENRLHYEENSQNFCSVSAQPSVPLLASESSHADGEIAVDGAPGRSDASTSGSSVLSMSSLRSILGNTKGVEKVLESLRPGQNISSAAVASLLDIFVTGDKAEFISPFIYSVAHEPSEQAPDFAPSIDIVYMPFLDAETNHWNLAIVRRTGHVNYVGPSSTTPKYVRLLREVGSMLYPKTDIQLQTITGSGINCLAEDSAISALVTVLAEVTGKAPIDTVDPNLWRHIFSAVLASTGPEGFSGSFPWLTLQRPPSPEFCHSSPAVITPGFLEELSRNLHAASVSLKAAKGYRQTASNLQTQVVLARDSLATASNALFTTISNAADSLKCEQAIYNQLSNISADYQILPQSHQSQPLLSILQTQIDSSEAQLSRAQLRYDNVNLKLRAIHSADGIVENLEVEIKDKVEAAKTEHAEAWNRYTEAFDEVKGVQRMLQQMQDMASRDIEEDRTYEVEATRHRKAKEDLRHGI